MNEGFPEIGEQNGWADTACVPDLDALRRAAHLDGVAMVLGDLWWSPERRVEVSPRNVLRAQCERAARRRATPRGPPSSTSSSSSPTPSRRRTRRATATSSRCTARRPTTPSTASTATRSCSASCGGRSSRAASRSSRSRAEMGHGQYEITFEPTAALAAADRAALGEAVHARDRRAARPVAPRSWRASRPPAWARPDTSTCRSPVTGGENLFDPDGDGPVAGRPPVHRRHHAPRAGVHGAGVPVRELLQAPRSRPTS